ncbi:AMP-binding protein [Variovorax sp. EL159]|uniref:AMP-binding protein n=1 Tax=Variovorax sp. EL159 TaxID=1566270 RepID=UPI00088822A5|nr:AMP-binding protein [Variovorax sp. EL159]SCX72574.1 feruloyl-CoA synthase [Variovorax sp. EL159]
MLENSPESARTIRSELLRPAPTEPTAYGRLPFRQPAIERIERSDGSFLLRWSDDAAVGLRERPLSADAPTTTVAANVVDWLSVWAAARPEAICLAERESSGAWYSVTYAEAWQQIRRIGGELRRRSVAHAGRHGLPIVPIAMLTGNSVRHALLTFAALYAGIPVAPVSPAYASPGGDRGQLRSLLQVLGPACFYVEERTAFAPVATELGLDSAGLVVGSGPDNDWSALLAGDEAIAQSGHETAHGKALAKVMFTSGSTGKPKAVVMTHAALAAAQAIAASVLEKIPDTQQVALDWLPWHHVMGGNIVLHRCLRMGTALHIDAGRPAPGAIAATVANLRELSPSQYINVPLGFGLLATEMERDPAFATRFFSKLEYLTFGGAALSRDTEDRLQRAAERAVGHRIAICAGYGATETCGPGISTFWPSNGADALGLPLPGVSVKLVPVADRYELRIAGPHLFSHYLGDAQASAAAFDEEGYYRTGDAVQWAQSDFPGAGLRFDGRLGEDFKLDSGTWVHVGSVRARLLAALGSFARDVVVTGENRRFVGALIFIDEAACRTLVPDMAHLGYVELASHAAVRTVLRIALERANTGRRASSKHIKRALVLPSAPSRDLGEVADKGYINQRAVISNRRESISALYAEVAPADVVCAPIDQQTD